MVGGVYQQGIRINLRISESSICTHVVAPNPNSESESARLKGVEASTRPPSQTSAAISGDHKSLFFAHAIESLNSKLLDDDG